MITSERLRQTFSEGGAQEIYQEIRAAGDFLGFARRYVFDSDYRVARSALWGLTLNIIERLSMDENTFTIRLHSTLYGRTYTEHSGYQDNRVEYGMGKGIMDPPDPDVYYNGLLRVRVVPYKKKEGNIEGTGLRSPALPTANDTDDTNTNPDGTWFDLQGRKFTGKPTQKGVYINNGKKRLKEGKRSS